MNEQQTVALQQTVTLNKCGNGCKNNKPEDFTEKHTQYGKLICNWCGWMWIHDCC